MQPGARYCDECADRMNDLIDLYMDDRMERLANQRRT